MIRCHKCGEYGTAQMHELPDKYYADYCKEGVPIYISHTDDGGQLCGPCFRKMGEEAVAFLDTVQRR